MPLADDLLQNRSHAFIVRRMIAQYRYRRFNKSCNLRSNIILCDGF